MAFLAAGSQLEQLLLIDYRNNTTAPSIAMNSIPKNVGKLVGENLYVHRLCLDSLDAILRGLIDQAYALAPDSIEAANVIKIDVKNRTLSFLNYPGFFEEAFPSLAESWRIRLDTQRLTYRSYSESLNPPILHRKELLIPLNHPQREAFLELTRQAEQLGLFGENHLIGFKRPWEQKIRAAGYVLDGHRLQPIGNDLSDARPDDESSTTSSEIQRHRTALSRSGLSAPMQALARHGLLGETSTLFDYGCGRGDDLAALRQNGVDANGWDPYFAPDQRKQRAQIVNLGFVINVIEEFDERVAALRCAFQLTDELLVVSAMLYGSSAPAGQPYRDGYVTTRQTFQKYFTQNELKEFVESVLDTEAIAVGPGIMFVFTDKGAEQRFLYGRQRSHHALRLLGYRSAQAPRASRSTRISKRDQKLSEHRELADTLWQSMLALGRIPEPLEFPEYPACLEAFGSWGRATRFVLEVNDAEEFSLAASERRADLLVYLALQLFSKRKRYRQLDEALQRDVKAHFGDYQKAMASAQALLLSVAEPAILDDACRVAESKGLGYYVESDYLQLHSSNIERLPPVLRIYVGCGSVLYGDMEEIDLVKIHIRSGKLTLMKFDDFDGKPVPVMTERIKIRLQDQDIDFFTYGSSYEPPPLYLKSRYLNEDYPMFEKQLRFDEELEALNLFDPDSFGPTLAQLEAAFSSRLEISDYAIAPSSSIPNLDDPCGANFTFRNFIECGETWERTRLTNIPKQAATFNALHALATNVLDPVIDYFGMIRLTYGFASAALSKEIPGRIAPRLDQHAGHELNRYGKPICARLGAAVDFLVEYEDMLDVAKWITENIPFDRLYIYGPDRPIHVSYGPEQARQVIVMNSTGPEGRLIPKTLSIEKFAAFQWAP